MFTAWGLVCVFVCVCAPIYVFIFLFQQVQGNPFYSGQLRTSTHKVHHQWRRKSCKKSKHRVQVAAGWRRVVVRVRVGFFLVWVGWGWVFAETSQHYTENHYGDSNQEAQGSEAWSERRAWEAADWRISPHSGWFNWQLPPGLRRTSHPQRPGALWNRDVASNPFSEGEKQRNWSQDITQSCRWWYFGISCYRWKCTKRKCANLKHINNIICHILDKCETLYLFFPYINIC